MMIQAHDRFGKTVTLTADGVAAFATAAGDLNPVHHDAAFAAGTRFKRPIASGTQTTALLMGVTASHFSQYGAMVGLEFWVQFKRPVFADETIQIEWLVVRAEPHERSGGMIVDLRGRIQNGAGETAVGAKGKVLVADAL